MYFLDLWRCFLVRLWAVSFSSCIRLKPGLDGRSNSCLCMLLVCLKILNVSGPFVWRMCCIGFGAGCIRIWLMLGCLVTKKWPFGTRLWKGPPVCRPCFGFLKPRFLKNLLLRSLSKSMVELTSFYDCGPQFACGRCLDTWISTACFVYALASASGSIRVHVSCERDSGWVPFWGCVCEDCVVGLNVPCEPSLLSARHVHLGWPAWVHFCWGGQKRCCQLSGIERRACVAGAGNQYPEVRLPGQWRWNWSSPAESFGWIQRLPWVERHYQVSWYW